MEFFTGEGSTVDRLLSDDYSGEHSLDVEERERIKMKGYLQTLDEFGRPRPEETGIQGRVMTEKDVVEPGDEADTLTVVRKLAITQESSTNEVIKGDDRIDDITSREDGRLSTDVNMVEGDEMMLRVVTEENQFDEDWENNLIAEYEQEHQTVDMQEPSEGNAAAEGKKVEGLPRSSTVVAQRKSVRQNLKWGDRAVGTKEMIEAAVKAKTPLPARDGMSANSISLLDIINDSILSQLADIGGIMVGNDEVERDQNFKMMRGWEHARHVWWSKNCGRLPVIEEEVNLVES